MTGPVLVFVWLARLGSADEPATEREAVIEERVQVTARKRAAEDPAAFATTLDMEDVARRGEDLADVLRRVPGSRVRDYGGLGSMATVSLRASTAEQVTVLVDGVPQNRALGGPVDLSSVPATQVERVTVFRGFAPAASGQGGIGGLIDVRTREPGPEPEVAIDLLAGQLDSQRLAGGVSLLAAGGRMRVGIEALHSDGDFRFYDDRGTPANAADDRTTQRVNNDVEQGSLVMRQVWEHAAGGELGLALRAEGRERGVPGKGNAQSTTARLDDRLFDLTGSWRRGLAGSALDAVELAFDAYDQVTDYRSGSDPITLSRDQTTELGGGGLAALVRGSLGRNAWLVRSETRYETARLESRPDVTADGQASRASLTLVAEDVVVAGRFTLAPSMRLESLRNRGFSGSEALEDVSWSGKLGTAVHVTDQFGVRASFGRYQRNPSLFELFGDSGEVAGNPALAPERGDAAELGLDWRGRAAEAAWRVELVGFAREVDDLIWLVPVSQGVSRPRNIARAEVQGLELALSLHGIARLSLDASSTWQHSEDTSAGWSQGNPLVYQPEWAGWTGLSWAGARFSARWEVSYMGENSTTQLDDPTFRVPERVLHDAYASWQWSNGLSAGADVRNVFDRAALDVLGYPLPDRVVYAHLGWQSQAAR